MTQQEMIQGVPSPSVEEERSIVVVINGRDLETIKKLIRCGGGASEFFQHCLRDEKIIAEFLEGLYDDEDCNINET